MRHRGATGAGPRPWRPGRWPGPRPATRPRLPNRPRCRRSDQRRGDPTRPGARVRPARRPDRPGRPRHRRPAPGPHWVGSCSWHSPGSISSPLFTRRRPTPVCTPPAPSLSHNANPWSKRISAKRTTCGPAMPVSAEPWGDRPTGPGPLNPAGERVPAVARCAGPAPRPARRRWSSRRGPGGSGRWSAPAR